MLHSGIDDKQHFGLKPLAMDATPAVALLVRPPWAEMIVKGQKIWELRSTATRKRGRIAIAQSGTGTLLGEVTIVDCLQVGRRCPDGTITSWNNEAHFLGAPDNIPKHCVEDVRAITYKSVWAWVLQAPTLYPSPVPYSHPQGAVIWVNLQKEPAAKRNRRQGDRDKVSSPKRRRR